MTEGDVLRALAALPAELRAPATLDAMARAAEALRGQLPGASVEIYRHRAADEITLRVARGERVYVRLGAPPDPAW